MVPIADHDDGYLAATLTYIRNSWGNRAERVTEKEMNRIREESKNLTGPLDEARLHTMMEDVPVAKRLWKLSATRKPEHLVHLLDEDPKTTWATKASMKEGDYVQVEFPHKRRMFKVILQATNDDHVEKIKVELSDNGSDWHVVADQVTGKRGTTVIPFPSSVGKFLRVTNLEARQNWWQLEAIDIIGPGMGDIDEYPESTRHYAQIREGKIIKNGWGDFRQNESAGGGPLKLAGTVFPKGIGSHAYSELAFDLTDKGYKRFYAQVGHDDGGHDTVTEFNVLLDNEVVFTSGDMAKGQAPQVVDLDVSNAKEIRLIVDIGSDKKPEGDHANWANACFIKD